MKKKKKTQKTNGVSSLLSKLGKMKVESYPYPEQLQFNMELGAFYKLNLDRSVMFEGTIKNEEETYKFLIVFSVPEAIQKLVERSDLLCLVRITKGIFDYIGSVTTQGEAITIRHVHDIMPLETLQKITLFVYNSVTKVLILSHVQEQLLFNDIYMQTKRHVYSVLENGEPASCLTLNKSLWSKLTDMTLEDVSFIKQFKPHKLIIRYYDIELMFIILGNKVNSIWTPIVICNGALDKNSSETKMCMMAKETKEGIVHCNFGIKKNRIILLTEVTKLYFQTINVFFECLLKIEALIHNPIIKEHFWMPSKCQKTNNRYIYRGTNRTINVQYEIVNPDDIITIGRTSRGAYERHADVWFVPEHEYDKRNGKHVKVKACWKGPNRNNIEARKEYVRHFNLYIPDELITK